MDCCLWTSTLCLSKDHQNTGQCFVQIPLPSPWGMWFLRKHERWLTSPSGVGHFWVAGYGQNLGWTGPTTHFLPHGSAH